MVKDSQVDLRRGDRVKIGLVKDDAVKTGKPVEGDIYSHLKNIRSNLLHLART